MNEHTAENDAYPLEGWIGLMADKHRPDEQRGGCICGFCAWSVEHVAIMAYRDAVDSARHIPPAEARREEAGKYVRCKRDNQLWCTHESCGYVPWSEAYRVTSPGEWDDPDPARRSR